MTTPSFPHTRLRRSRQHDWSRRLVAEHHLRVDDLIWPLFVCEDDAAGPIASMPNVERHSLRGIIMQARFAWQMGIPAIAIFPATPPALKCAEGKEALNRDNLVCRTVRAVKDAVPELGIICDVALDPYTSHGHDGLVRGGAVDNDATLDMLCRQALIQAEAGCDVLAPSDMMDGRIGAIRAALEAEGFSNVLLLSYAAKYASAFYGPFRDAVGSAASLKGGDKRGYQMNPANGDEALREVALDIAEGADWIMVKPGLPYLDIIRRVHERFDVPLMAYHTSGEYAMLHAAAAAGMLNEEAATMEVMLSFKRAGCSAIFTYAAPAIAQWLQG